MTEKESSDQTQVPRLELPPQPDPSLSDLMEQTTLKPCPFCGSDDIKGAVHTKGLDGGTPFYLHSLWCCSCSCSNCRESPAELIEWWNTRDYEPIAESEC